MSGTISTKQSNLSYQEEDGSDDIIRHSFSSNRCRFLLASGVDHDSFMRRESSFALGDSLYKITTDIPKVMAKNVSVNKQLKTFNTLVEKPLTGNPVICLSSFPTDLRAKQVALYLMNRAIDCYNTSKIRRIKTKASPIWHRVYSGFKDSLLDKSNSTDTVSSDYPCYLVISNLDVNSSNTKLEKVRDLLDKYSDIPRIVITSPDDPLTFFATKLHYMVTAGLFLCPGNRTVTTL